MDHMLHTHIALMFSSLNARFLRELRLAAARHNLTVLRGSLRS